MPLDSWISASVLRKLSALKRRLLAHLLAGAAAWAIAAAVAGVFGTLLVDYLLRGDLLQRALFAVIALAGLGYVAWRFALRPLRVPMGPDELALVLERHYPQLDDRLISALQFAGRPMPGASQPMMRKVTEQANALAGGLDPAGPIRAGRTWRKVSIAAATLAFLAAFTAFNPVVMACWFQRNVLFQDVEYPRQTYLTVQGGPEFRAVIGDDLVITVTADPDHVVPERVTFHMSYPSVAGSVDEDAAAESPGSNVFVKTFEKVSESFDFHVTGKDDTTDTFHVTVARRPEVVSMGFRIDYPEYMGRRPERLSEEHGVLAVPPGSRLTLGGTASKDLVGGQLLLDGEVAAELTISPATLPDGRTAPRGIQGTISLPRRAGSRSTNLTVRLVDAEKITNDRAGRYLLRIQADQAPSVNLGRRAVRADVTARALLPLLIHCRDDHGVADVRIVSTARALEAATTAPAATTRPATVFRPVPLSPDQAGSREVRLEHELDLVPLKLQVGQLVRIRALARDTLPASFGGPNAARSPVHTFRIISEEELLAELVRRQKEIREHFTRTVALQAAVRDKIRAVREELGGAAAVPASVVEGIETAARDQRRVRTQSTVTAERLQGVHDELMYNRAGDPNDLRQMLLEVIGPLRELGEKTIPDVGASLTRASKQTDAGELGRHLDRDIDRLKALYDSLEDILTKMHRLETRQELANLLKDIIRRAGLLHNAIRVLRRVETDEVFGPTTQPGE